MKRGMKGGKEGKKGSGIETRRKGGFVEKRGGGRGADLALKSRLDSRRKDVYDGGRRTGTLAANGMPENLSNCRQRLSSPSFLPRLALIRQ